MLTELSAGMSRPAGAKAEAVFFLIGTSRADKRKKDKRKGSKRKTPATAPTSLFLFRVLVQTCLHIVLSDNLTTVAIRYDYAGFACANLNVHGSSPSHQR